MINIMNKSTDRPILTLSALTALFLLPLSLIKKDNELNKLIMISRNKNINIVFNISNFFIYET